MRLFYRPSSAPLAPFDFAMCVHVPPTSDFICFSGQREHLFHKPPVFHPSGLMAKTHTGFGDPPGAQSNSRGPSVWREEGWQPVETGGSNVQGRGRFTAALMQHRISVIDFTCFRLKQTVLFSLGTYSSLDEDVLQNQATEPRTSSGFSSLFVCLFLCVNNYSWNSQIKQFPLQSSRFRDRWGRFVNRVLLTGRDVKKALCKCLIAPVDIQ